MQDVAVSLTVRVAFSYNDRQARVDGKAKRRETLFLERFDFWDGQSFSKNELKRWVTRYGSL